MLLVYSPVANQEANKNLWFERVCQDRWFKSCSSQKKKKTSSFLSLQQLKLLKILSGYSSSQFSYLIISMYLFLLQFLFLLSDNPFLEGTKINSPFYLAKLNAPKGTKRFTLVVSQYEKTNTIHYTIKVCPPTFHLITSSYRPILAFV